MFGLNFAFKSRLPEGEPIVDNALLKEDNDFILLESGDLILKEE
jgi:hypothetical protein